MQLKINYTMKKVILLLLLFSFRFQHSNAQVFPFYDDFESYSAFNVPTGYAGNITVYLTHGTAGSKGLAGYLTSFSNSDSLIFPAIGPLSMFSVLEFDWRMMDPFLYPSTSATLTSGDSFSILISTDGITWTSIFNIDSSNFLGATTFENTIIPLASYAGQVIQLKIKGTRANGSAEFFIDIDNVFVDVPGAISNINELNAFSVYPTPAFHSINYSNPLPFTGNLQIVDLMGKVVFEKVVHNSMSGQIDIMNLTPGNYRLIVKSETGNTTCALVIR